MTERKILKIIQGSQTQDGAGVKLTRVLSNKTMYEFDPFLMLDFFDSFDSNDYIKGFPWHPHRGIETITYLIDGQIDHQDSLHNKGTIKANETQWMTAGSGILHQEMPQVSDHMLGFQLWLNMPKEQKMQPPAYHSLPLEDANIFQDTNATVRVISGDYQKKAFGYQPKFIEARIMDISLYENKSITLHTDPDHTVFIFTIIDKVKIQNQIIDNKMAILFDHGNSIVVSALSSNARFIYFEAKPLHQDIAWGGPIVMNTQQELQEAFMALDNGTFIQ